MLICDRCGASIPDDARFCAKCGDPVTEADKASSRLTRSTERVQLICPKCNQISLYDIPAHGTADETCPSCSTTFQTRVMRVRSKRSAGNKQSNSRQFSVRVQDLSGRDDLVEF